MSSWTQCAWTGYRADVNYTSKEPSKDSSNKWGLAWKAYNVGAFYTIVIEATDSFDIDSPHVKGDSCLEDPLEWQWNEDRNDNKNLVNQLLFERMGEDVKANMFITRIKNLQDQMIAIDWLVTWGVMWVKKVVSVLCWCAYVAVFLSFNNFCQEKPKAPFVLIF